MSEIAYPQKLSLCIGSYIGQSTGIQWDNRKKQLLYGTTEYGPCLDMDVLSGFVPTELDWERFWIDVRNIGVWYWKDRYENNNVLDGSFWSLDIRYGDKQLTSKGTNAYPQQGTNIPSEAFKQLLRAFGELMSDKDFINTWYETPWY